MRGCNSLSMEYGSRFVSEADDNSLKFFRVRLEHFRGMQRIAYCRIIFDSARFEVDWLAKMELSPRYVNLAAE